MINKLWFVYCYLVAKYKEKFLGYNFEIAYIGMQFKDLKSAKKFAYIWWAKYDQELPFLYCYGMRAMASEMSDILEGYKVPTDRLYFSTQYGSELYESFCNKDC